MRLFGAQEPPDEAEQSAPEGKGPSIAERAILGLLASNPAFAEAIKGMLAAVQQNQEQQAEILAKVRDIHLWMTQERALRLGNARSKLNLEGVISDGEHCPICNATEACDCFPTEEQARAAIAALPEGENHGQG